MWTATGKRVHQLPFILLAALTVSSCLMIGGFLYQNQVDKSLQQFRQVHTDKLYLTATLLNRELGELQEITRLIYQDKRLHTALAIDKPLDEQKIKEVFRQYGISIDNLLQLRWLDHSGKEIVRANIQDDTSVNFTPPSQLQNKHGRYYFSEAYAATDNSIYISPIDLNIENGRYVIPLQATVRTALRTGFKDQLRAGVLLVNYNLNKLLDSIRSENDPMSFIKILDSKGQWLLHPNPDKIWAYALSTDTPTLNKSQPALWQQLQTTEGGEYRSTSGSFNSYRSIMLADEPSTSANTRLSIITQTPAQYLQVLYTRAALKAIGLTLVLLIFVSLLLYRELHSRKRIHRMGQMLESENRHLLELNDELDTALHRQQKLQDDLVEQRKLSALGMTVAGVAHELNTPLGGAILITSEQRNRLADLQHAVDTGLTRTALDQYLQDSTQSLEMVESNLKSARRQIEGFKRLAYERMDEALVNFEVHTLAEDLLHTLSPQLKSAGVEVHNGIPGNIFMHNTPGILSQVMQNLIINALKHGFHGFGGGKITLDAAMVSGSVLRLSICDNGRGISPQLVPKLFDPFITSARSQNHTGLGLHLVYQWVTEQLNGTVRYAHNTPNGACFILEMPAEDKRKEQEKSGPTTVDQMKY